MKLGFHLETRPSAWLIAWLAFVAGLLMMVFIGGGCATSSGDFSKLGQTEGEYLPRTEMPGETTIHYTTPEFHYEQKGEGN